MELTRRHLLASIPAVAAAVASGQEYRIGKADFKLGVASYSLRKFSREQAIAMTKELGTPYLNIKDFHLAMNSTPQQIDEARKQFADAGIQITGCGTIYFLKDDEADMRSKFEYVKRLGAPLIVAGPSHETLPKLEKYVKEYDIKLAIHNHGPEDKHFPTPDSVLEAVKNLDPRCGLCMDIGHTARTDADIVGSIRKAGPRLLAMHLKDLADIHDKGSQVAVGQGKLPIRAIFEQLIRMGYRGNADLEYEINETNPLPGMKGSFAYMHKVLKELSAKS